MRRQRSVVMLPSSAVYSRRRPFPSGLPRAPWSRNSRCSHAFASFQSRITVSTDTFKTEAVSSTLSPPKNRSSITRALRSSTVGQRLERIVEGDEILTWLVRHDQRVIKRHSDGPAAALLVALRPGDVHEDAPHQPRGHREEVGPVLPVDVLDVDQPEVRLVHQRRRLQAVPAALARHAAPRDPPQFVVHQRDQLVEGGLIALPPCEEKSGDLVRVAAECPNPTLFLAACQFRAGFPPLSARRETRWPGQRQGVGGCGGVDGGSGAANRRRSSVDETWPSSSSVTDDTHVSPGDLAEAEQLAFECTCTAGAASRLDDGAAADSGTRRRLSCGRHSRVEGHVAGKSQSRGIAEQVFGRASRPTGVPTIFYDRIADHAKRTGSSVAVLLGAVIAHEVGHLLLPAFSHSPTGIMRPHWDGRIMRVPDFTVDQGNTIRTRLPIEHQVAHAELEVVPHSTMSYSPENSRSMLTKLKPGTWPA